MKSRPHFYRAYGLTLASAISIPELPRCGDGIADVCVERWNSVEPRGDIAWLDRSMRGGRAWLALGATANGHVLRFPGLAEFRVAPRRIELRRVKGIPATTARHLLLDHVLPRVLDLRGALVLHGACVASPAGAVLLLGPSGRGKSTLATTLAHHGFALLGDDVTVLEPLGERWIARASYPSVRLWPDSVAALVEGPTHAVRHDMTKRRADARRFAAAHDVAPTHALAPMTEADAVPIARAFVLTAAPADARPSITPISPRAAFAELAAQTFRFDPTHRDALRDEFTTLVRLAAHPGFRRLEVPRTHGALPDVVRCIREDLER